MPSTPPHWLNPGESFRSKANLSGTRLTAVLGNHQQLANMNFSKPSPPAEISETERVCIRKLVPFLLLLYVLAFIDRVNVGYAKHSFLHDTGLSEAAFAFGAGIFFLGYALFEVPSNLIMHRVGARIWICRIMVTWGLIATAMMFAHNEATFYTLRFLLGVAEAGFFPGVIYYLTFWFPANRLGLVLGLFYFGAPLAQIIGGPVSGLLLEFDQFAGLHGWQWMFLIEGLAAVVAGIAVFFYLPSRPSEARWLDSSQKKTLLAAIAKNRKPVEAHASVFTTLRHPRILYFGFLYALIQMSVYGVIFYLPSQVAQLLGESAGFKVGMVSAIPWVCALAAAYQLPRLATRFNRSREIAAFAMFAATIGIAFSSISSPQLALLAMCVATAGFIGAQPIFWSFPASELTGAQAAGGIALINSLGAVGGFLAPNLKIWADKLLEIPWAGNLALASASLLSAILFLRLKITAR